MLNGVSTRSVNMALQRSLLVMQRDLSTQQVEVQTGKYADIGLSLGVRSEAVVSMVGEVKRLEAIIETNKLATARLDVTQSSLETVRNGSSAVFSALAAGVQTTNGRELASASAKSSLGRMVSALNTTIAGQHIFGGINTGTNPIISSNGIPAGIEADAAFQAYFGFAKTDPAASLISAADFSTFIVSEVEPLFLGASWNGTVSMASDVEIQSRITLQEVAATSVSANETGIRRTLYGVSLAANFLNSALNVEVANFVVETSASAILTGESEIELLQSKAGLVQERLSKADTRISGQRDMLLDLGNNMSSVDPYEASVKINSLLSQIEISYALTQKIQNLSILRFLG